MSINLKIALIIITLIYLLLILRALKNKKLQVSFSMFWIISTLILIVAIIIPNFVEYLTKLLGFELPSNMIFCVTIFIAFYLIFNITLKLSQEHQKNVVLLQELSILKKKVSDLEKDKKDI